VNNSIFDSTTEKEIHNRSDGSGAFEALLRLVAEALVFRSATAFIPTGAQPCAGSFLCLPPIKGLFGISKRNGQTRLIIPATRSERHLAEATIETNIPGG
jgi:hypothetical protein